MAKTVLEKMGYAEGAAGLVHGAPPALSACFAAVERTDDAPHWLVAFIRTRSEVVEIGLRIAERYERGGHLWLAYPKTSGSIASDISRDSGWGPLLDIDLLPVSQVSLDADWSAMRFRYRDEIATVRRKTRLGDTR